MALCFGTASCISVNDFMTICWQFQIYVTQNVIHFLSLTFPKSELPNIGAHLHKSVHRQACNHLYCIKSVRLSTQLPAVSDCHAKETKALVFRAK